ncbi:MAG: Transketolase, partial [Alphaproteobacteria bacterium MarineAlpha5_Bin11]
MIVLYSSPTPNGRKISILLEELGVLSNDDLGKYCTPEGILGAHPDYETPGIEAATGSLGHGLSMAVGMSYAEKIKGTDSTIYTVLSDGEVQEGSTWEAVLMASTFNTTNLIAFVDYNDFQ